MEQEIWKDIPWYEWRYQVSIFWNCRSIHWWRWNKWYIKILRWSYDSCWYKRITINWKKKSIHRLVAITFINNYNNKKEVNHINWIKDDNRVENLEWCTPSENIRHAFKIWIHKWWLFWKQWKLHPRSKKVNQYDLWWTFIKSWDSINIAWRQLNINISHISECCRNYKWCKTAGWFIWRHNNSNN